MAQLMVDTGSGFDNPSVDPSADSPLSIDVPHEVTLVAPALSISGRRRLTYRHVGKRVLDVVVASLALFVLSPVFCSVWAALRLSLGPRVVLKQQRIGRGGTAFSLIKFRTMEGCRRTDGDSCAFLGEDRRLTHKSCEDPRHTNLGRIVRRFSLDELPQLVNILKGDMSLVGPRPELASVASQGFRLHPRHSVRPGLTGSFQVSDLRAGAKLAAGLSLDEDYVSRLGLWTDVRILSQTIAALRRGTGS